MDWCSPSSWPLGWPADAVLGKDNGMGEKFAQLVGLIFAVIGAAGFAAGAPLVGLVATGAALVAAFLNAAFGICLGCQLYPLVVHLKPANRTSEPA